MLKARFLILLFSMLLLTACNDTSNKEVTSSLQKESSVKTLYPWLEGEWRGELFFHAEDRNISASLSYHDGKLNVSFPNHCEGEGKFVSNKDTSGIFITAQNKTFKLNPTNGDETIDKNFENLKDIKLIYIQYYADSKLAGWLEKE